jgi:DNA helicase-2/ATP-dependent DNA helicase PcrA
MHLNKINKEQKAAVTYTGKHLLLLAGAGTGKTHTIVARAAWLITNGILPERIKIISFTKKSANEIALRTQKLLSGIPGNKSTQGATFHGWCLEIIRSNPSFFNMNKWTVIDTDDQEVIMRNTIDRYSSGISYDVKASDVLSIRSYQLNTECNIEEAIQKTLHNKPQKVEFLINDIDTIISIIESYEKYKKTHLYLDYDDILTIAVATLTKCDELRVRVTSMYDHILVDEMQDTNPLQWKLLEIFMPSCHLFCVGDDAQSIYAFRGADFHSIHSFSKRVPDSSVMKLVRNYRSSQAILDVSNKLLELSPLQYNKKLIAQQKKGKKPAFVFVSNKTEEAAFIRREIQKHIKSGIKYADHMILARNAYQAKRVEAAFLSKQIPYVLYGGISLMKSAHIRDAMSVLRIISNPEDELAWMRYLCLWPGIGKVKVRKIIDEMASEKSVLEKVKIMMTTDSFAFPAKVINDAYTQIKAPTACISTTIESMSSFLKEKYAKDWVRRKKDFTTLIEIASSSQSVTSFISDYLLDSNINNNSQNDAVVISTIHSAKGLEANFCYILDMCIGNYPSNVAVKAGTDAIEEERRCLYVALTRAKKELTILTEYNTWVMTKPFYSKTTALKEGDVYTSIHPTPSNPPFKTAQVSSINGTEISYHLGGKTMYTSLAEFFSLYKVKDEKYPGLSIPHFFFSQMNLDLLDCISGNNQKTNKSIVNPNINNKFNFFK